MENVQQFLRGLELDNRTAALLTGAACGVGALVVLVRQVNSQQEAEKKIQRARNRRAESLQRAEKAVFQYKESVRAERKHIFSFRCIVNFFISIDKQHNGIICCHRASLSCGKS